MDSSETGAKKVGNGVLGVILGVLIFMVVCLAVPIFFLKSDARNLGDNTSGASRCITEESLTEINTCIDEVFRSSNDLNVVVSEYSTIIQLYKERGDETLSTDLIISMIRLLIKEGRCEEVLDVLKSKDLDSYNAFSLYRIYFEVLYPELKCDNLEELKQLEESIDEVKKEVEKNVIQS